MKTDYPKLWIYGSLLVLLLQVHFSAGAQNQQGEKAKGPRVAAAPVERKQQQVSQPSSGARSSAPRKSAHAASEEGPAVGSDIIETAMKLGNYATFISLLEVAGLTNTLTEAGPFTVFAPPDAAFAKLPAGALDELKKPESKEKLRALLGRHIIKGRMMTADLGRLAGRKAQPIAGGELPVSTADDLKVEGVVVTQTDIKASNGIIHEVSDVLTSNSGNSQKATKKEAPQ